MAEFNLVHSLFGGVLIGLAAAGMLWANGRVMGVSGIIGGLLAPQSKDTYWRVMFLAGVLVGGFFIPQLGLSVMTTALDIGLGAYIVAGFLVGFGTTLGNGCTSGHGVCGLSRFSFRSLAATITFILFGILTVVVMKLLSGGVS